jgi:hypothetical protein
MILHLHRSSSTLAQIVNKFHYGIYTYMESKSQTIYMQNTDLNICVLSCGGLGWSISSTRTITFTFLREVLSDWIKPKKC